MKQLTEIQALIDAQRDEIKTLKDRLILAQSEALAAIQKNEPKPEPRDIGHENVISFVTRKSGELQVSPGIVWGLVMDLIAKNTNHFGTDADACPEPVEPVEEFEPFGFRVGDVVRIVKDDIDESLNGKIGTIEGVRKNDKYPYRLSILNHYGLNAFACHELEFVSRP